jgi:hypothetical protein
MEEKCGSVKEETLSFEVQVVYEELTLTTNRQGDK